MLTFAQLVAILENEGGAPVTAVAAGGVDNPEGKKLTKKLARRKKKKDDDDTDS